METNKDRPFFAYVAHHAVHVPLQARPETIARFAAKTPGKQHTNVVYAASTYDLDDGVGILLKKITDLGLDKNTLIIFTSDNGGTPTSPQEPLRGNKGCYYEGGIREPFIARWPGVTKPHTRCEVPIVNVDLFPTFAAAAGAALPRASRSTARTCCRFCAVGIRSNAKPSSGISPAISTAQCFADAIPCSAPVRSV